jgi:hypothetical protein
MKTFKLSLITLLLLGAVSCSKNESGSPTGAITTDQAADMATGALSVNSFGFAATTDAVTLNAQTVVNSTGSQSVNSVGTTSVHQTCGTTLTDSISNSGSSSSVTFSYFFKFSHTLNCNTSSQPDNIANSLIYHGNYDGPRLTSADAGTETITVGGLTTTATDFLINGEYKRTGSFISKVGNKASGNSNVDIVVTNLTLTKPARKIASGSATIAISGTSAKGSFSFNGTLVFNGDNTATLTVSGSVYIINLLTGIYTKK